VGRILNAHIYHIEKEDRHHPPEYPSDLEGRLQLLQRLPVCDWWVIELRDEPSILKTLRAIRQFLLEERVER
jgi:hypothetical protein